MQCKEKPLTKTLTMKAMFDGKYCSNGCEWKNGICMAYNKDLVPVFNCNECDETFRCEECILDVKSA